MKIRTATAHLIVICVFFVGTAAEAQLFGSERQLGSPISRQSRPGQGGQSNAGGGAVDTGQVQGNERFLRTNRRRGAFVGSDRLERRSFVGSQQGTSNGPVIQSTTGVRPNRDRSAQVNRAVDKPTRKQAYAPRLVLDLATVPSPGIRMGNLLRRELENPEHFSATNRYEVLVEGRTAILRGVVADAKERDLAELLVSFEPGISAVRNELTTQSMGSRTVNRDSETPRLEAVDSGTADFELPPPPVPAVNRALLVPPVPTNSNR